VLEGKFNDNNNTAPQTPTRSSARGTRSRRAATERGTCTTRTPPAGRKQQTNRTRRNNYWPWFFLNLFLFFLPENPIGKRNDFGVEMQWG
jgi:hypothetical protein